MMQDLEDLSMKVATVQEIRQHIHQVQEELNWQYEKSETLKGERLHLTLVHFLFQKKC